MKDEDVKVGNYYKITSPVSAWWVVKVVELGTYVEANILVYSCVAVAPPKLGRFYFPSYDIANWEDLTCAEVTQYMLEN